MRSAALLTLVAVGCHSWRVVNPSDINAADCLVVTSSRAYELRDARGDESGVQGQRVREWWIERGDIEIDDRSPDDLARGSAWEPAPATATTVFIRRDEIQQATEYRFDRHKLAISIGIGVGVALLAGLVITATAMSDVRSH